MSWLTWHWFEPQSRQHDQSWFEASWWSLKGGNCSSSLDFDLTHVYCYQNIKYNCSHSSVLIFCSMIQDKRVVHTLPQLSGSQAKCMQNLYVQMNNFWGFLMSSNFGLQFWSWLKTHANPFSYSYFIRHCPRISITKHLLAKWNGRSAGTNQLVESCLLKTRVSSANQRMNDKTSPSLVRDVTWHAVLTRVKVKFESLPDKSCVDLSEVSW